MYRDGPARRKCTIACMETMDHPADCCIETALHNTSENYADIMM